MPKVRIEVTAEDIMDGVRDNCCACPVALAIKRADGGERVVRVYQGAGFVNVAENRRRFELPDEVTDFIRAFDDRKRVQPFAFDLDLPEAS